MKKLLLGIILGGLFFAYGESYRPHPMAYVGNKIRDISLITIDNSSVGTSKKDNIFKSNWGGLLLGGLEKTFLYSRPAKILMYNKNLEFYCETLELEMANDMTIDYLRFEIPAEKPDMEKYIENLTEGYQLHLFDLDSFKSLKPSNNREGEKDVWHKFCYLNKTFGFPSYDDSPWLYTFGKRRNTYKEEYLECLLNKDYKIPYYYKGELAETEFKINIPLLQKENKFYKVYKKDNLIMTFHYIEREDGKNFIRCEEFREDILKEFECYDIYNLYTNYFYYVGHLRGDDSEREQILAFLAYKSGNTQDEYKYKVVE